MMCCGSVRLEGSEDNGRRLSIPGHWYANPWPTDVWGITTRRLHLWRPSSFALMEECAHIRLSILIFIAAVRLATMLPTCLQAWHARNITLGIPHVLGNTKHCAEKGKCLRGASGGASSDPLNTSLKPRCHARDSPAMEGVTERGGGNCNGDVTEGRLSF